MDGFFRFPHTPHIAWLGNDVPRDDKVLAPDDVRSLLSDTVVVEEKLDGANLGISLKHHGVLHAQNRGQYLTEPFSGQFSRLSTWLALHNHTLVNLLDKNLILFGEWCAAKHSLDYDSLPDWFVVFDVYDRNAERFWSTRRRDALATKLELPYAPCLFSGKASLASVRELLETYQSRYRTGPPEGIVVRKETADWSQARAKLVREEFTQTITEHWRNRAIQWNRVGGFGGT